MKKMYKFSYEHTTCEEEDGEPITRCVAGTLVDTFTAWFTTLNIWTWLLGLKVACTVVESVDDSLVDKRSYKDRMVRIIICKIIKYKEI